MRLFKTAISTVILSFIMKTNAWANGGPYASGLILVTIPLLLFLVMMLATGLSGGYRVLETIEKTHSRTRHIMLYEYERLMPLITAFFSVLVFLNSMGATGLILGVIVIALAYGAYKLRPVYAYTMGFVLLVAGQIISFIPLLALLLMLASLLMASARAVMLFRLGKRAEVSPDRPDYLEGIRPWRLHAGGGLLIIAAVLSILLSIGVYGSERESARRMSLKRVALRAEGILREWIYYSQKTGEESGLNEIDTNGDYKIDSSDLTNKALRQAGICNTFVLSEKDRTSSRGSVPLWSTSAQNGPIQCEQIDDKTIGIRARDLNGKLIYNSTIIYKDGITSVER